MFFVILLYAIFGATLTLNKVALQYTSPILLAGLRLSLAGFILLAYHYFIAHHQLRFKLKNMKWYLQIIVLSVFIPSTCRIWALSYMPPYKVALLNNLAPFITYLLACSFFGEKFRTNKILGLIIGFAGVIPILIAAAPTEDLISAFGFISWPEIAVMIAVAGRSYGSFIIQKFVKYKRYAPTMINGITMFFGGLLALFASLLIEPTHSISNPLIFSGILLTIIFGSNIIGHTLYGYLLRKYSTTFMSFASFLLTVFTAVFSKIILRDKITWHFYVGIILVSFGLYIFYKDEISYQAA